MPKTKFQDVVFTLIMASVMVYGMVVYNVSLNRGGVETVNFVLALRELPIMVAVAFVLEFFLVGKLARTLAFTVVKRPAAGDRLRRVYLHLLHHVPDHEPHRHVPVQDPRLRDLGRDLRAELPDGDLLADVFLRAARAAHFQEHLPREGRPERAGLTAGRSLLLRYIKETRLFVLILSKNANIACLLRAQIVL